MYTGAYYGGEPCTVGKVSGREFLNGPPDEETPAPEKADGTLQRFGNVIIATKSGNRFSFRTNESAVRVMKWARDRGQYKSD